MPLNLEKYRPYLDEFDMSTEQKDEFIQTLWTVMQSFADQAFECSPENIDILPKRHDKNCCKPVKMVEFSHQFNFIDKAANDNMRKDT